MSVAEPGRRGEGRLGGVGTGQRDGRTVGLDPAKVSVSPSGSLEPVPSSVTVAPSSTLRSGPASATGVSLTVTVTESVSVRAVPVVGDGELEGEHRRAGRGGEASGRGGGPGEGDGRAGGLDPGVGQRVAIGIEGAGAVEGDGVALLGVLSGPASAVGRR